MFWFKLYLCTDSVISFFRGRFYARCAKNSPLYREYRYIEDRYIGVLSHTFYCNFCRDIAYLSLYRGYCYIEDRCIGIPLYKGLVDPKNKPFGNLLPFEVQVIIMFWTQCFMTNDRRTKINEELTRLPSCHRTAIPMSVAFSFSSGYKRFSSAMENKPYPRFYGCPHCFRRNTTSAVSVFIYFPSVLFHAYR